MLSNTYKTFLTVFITAFAMTLSLSANPKSLAFSDLKAKTEVMIQTGDLANAIPYLEEMINRADAQKDPNKRQPLESMFFFTGRGYMMEFGVSAKKSDLNKALEIVFASSS